MKAGVAGVPQGRRVFPGLTVLDNLRVGASTRGRQATSDVDWALDLFPGLRAQAYRPAGALPVGEQQVLALARALVSRPEAAGGRRAFGRGFPGAGRPAVRRPAGAAAWPGSSLLVIDQFVNLTLGLADRAIVVENSRVCVSFRPG